MCVFYNLWNKWKWSSVDFHHQTICMRTESDLWMNLRNFDIVRWMKIDLFKNIGRIFYLVTVLPNASNESAHVMSWHNSRRNKDKPHDYARQLNSFYSNECFYTFLSVGRADAVDDALGWFSCSARTDTAMKCSNPCWIWSGLQRV